MLKDSSFIIYEKSKWLPITLNSRLMSQLKKVVKCFYLTYICDKQNVVISPQSKDM